MPKILKKRAQLLFAGPAYFILMWLSPDPYPMFRYFNDESCLQHAASRSVTGSPLRISYRNLFGKKVNIYWVSYDGSKIFYKDIPIGGLFVVDTYIGHVWRVETTNNTCVQVFTAEELIAGGGGLMHRLAGAIASGRSFTETTAGLD